MSIMLLIMSVSSFAKLAEYRFTECQGVTIANSVNSDLNGTLGGDAVLVEGESALAFAGQGEMVVEHDDRLDIVGDLTIAFWVNPASMGRQALIVRGDGEGNESDRLYGSNAEYSLVLWEDGHFKYKHNQTADTFSNAIIAQDEWTHIALVRNNTTQLIEIYINGLLDVNNTYSIPPRSSHTEKLLVGTGESYSSTMGNFDGKIDEIKIYNIGLTAEEIVAMYEAEKDGVHLESTCEEALEDGNETSTDSEENATTLLTEENTTSTATTSPTTTTVATTVVPTYVVPATPALSLAETTFSIGNRVWLDEDGDGLQSSSDIGAEGVEVTLYNENEEIVATTQTDSDGAYLFDAVPAGSYVLAFSNLPENYTFTTANVGMDDTLDSDVDEQTGQTVLFELDGNNLSWDVGLVLLENEEENVSTSSDLLENDTVSVPLTSVIDEGNETLTVVSAEESEKCVCDTYDSSIPSLGEIGMILLLLFTTLVAGVLFQREESVLVK